MPKKRTDLKEVERQRKARERNRSVRSSLKTFVRKALELIAAGQKDEATKAVHLACARLDRAAQKGIIHDNQAARRKSRLMHRFNSTFTAA